MSTSRDYVSGNVLTAAQMDDLNQGIVAWATPVASNVGPTSGTTSLDVITAPAITPAQTGRRFRIRFQWRGITATVAGDFFNMRIQEGATVLNEQSITMTSTGQSFNGGSLEATVDSPTVAAHTYKATITRSAGTGTGTIAGAATFPILFYVEDVGTV